MRGLIPRTPAELFPFSDVMWPLEERMDREIERTFDRWMRAFNEDIEENLMPLPTLPIIPAATMEEDENEVLITTEMPGLEKDEFKVELLGDRLIIHGEKKTQPEEHKGEPRHVESRYGLFSRIFVLPCPVKTDEIKAEYRNGELKVHLPKTEEAKAKLIEVQVA